MKVDLTKIARDQFIVREEQIAGETCHLIFPPHIGTKWDKQNLIFRSSIWNSEGELISASFKKFFNWGEKPDLAYTPFSTSANGGIDVITKEDGSTLIVSMYKGQLITRTRGTFCATALDNGHEIAYLMSKYPDAFDLEVDKDGTCNYSLIFEWVTPNNVIVINYGQDPDIILIGKIYHDSYRMETQANLDILADSLGVLLLGGCFLREAPEGAIGSDRRAGKWGLRGKRGRKRCFGVSVGGVSVRKIPSPRR